MPKLVRLYITQTAIGFALSAAFVALLLWFDVAGLWHLVSGSRDGVLAVFLLWMFNGIVFSGVQFGIAVTLMTERRPGGPGKPRRQRVAPAALAVPVAAEAAPRRR